MLDSISQQILIFIKRNHPTSTNELVKYFAIKRTTINYHLDRLIELELIEKHKIGKMTNYTLVSIAVIEEYFSKYKKDIDLLISDIKNDNSNRNSNKIIRKKLAIVNYYDILPNYRKELEEYYDIDDFSDKDIFISFKEFLFRAKDADVVINNGGCSIREQEISQLSNLKYVHVTTHMYRYVDIESLKRGNIHFSYLNNPEYRSSSLSEFAIAQTFALFRGVREASQQLQSGVYDFRYFKGELLRGKTVGILGTDAISIDLSRMLINLGTEVMFYTEDERIQTNNIGISKFYSLEQIFKRADIIYSVNSTDNLLRATNSLDKELFKHVTKPIYFISLSKHNFVDYDLIRKLLYSGKLLGITLDGGFQEEVQKSELEKILYIPNVLVTPDIGWYTSNSVENMNRITNQFLIAYAKDDNSYLLF